MKNLAMMTSVNVKTAMYYTRVMTFDFATNGIGVPFFRQSKLMRS
ncbi:RAxF-45 family protein [Lysinibacillus sp. BW-2-10]|nr:RAxF-45 family protein [Lysinibacillus sp. BW-2-10]